MPWPRLADAASRAASGCLPLCSLARGYNNVFFDRLRGGAAVRLNQRRLAKLAAAVDRRWGISPSGAQGGAGYPPLGAPTRDAVAGAPRLPTLLPSARGLLEPGQTATPCAPPQPGRR